MTHPLESLRQGRWFKLICGASFHHLPSIRNLALVYTLAGADCIDLAADPAIVRAAQSGINAALAWDPHCLAPWLMASFNDGEDPHFRKAQLGEVACPSDCSQPCLSVCPPHAIQAMAGKMIQIQADMCYGCGRCQPVCPPQLIDMAGYQVPMAVVFPSLIDQGVSAVEIHTQVGRLAEFSQLWQALKPWLPQLQVVSISLGDGEDLESYLRSLLRAMDPFPQTLIWQTDGRPMSGDIGAGTTQFALRLAQKVVAMKLPGSVQLAGGTNQATVPRLPSDLKIAGIAYGSYARQLVATAIEGADLTTDPDQLQLAVQAARQLVWQIKTHSWGPQVEDRRVHSLRS